MKSDEASCAADSGQALTELSGEFLESDAFAPVTAHQVRLRRLILFQRIGLAILFYFLVHSILEGALYSSWTNLAAFVAVALSIIALHALGRFRLACWLLLLGLNCSMAFGAAFDGSIDSPGLWMISLLPMISACILGARATMAWTLLAAIEILAMSLLSQSESLQPELSLEGLNRVFTLIISLGAHSLTAFLLSTHLVSQLRRVAERKELLENAHQAESKANEEKKKFLARMSHEIRDPMNGLMGMMAELRDQASMADHREDIDTVNRCGENLLSLMNELLDLSKVESGQFELRSAPVELVGLVRDVRQLFVSQAILLGVEIFADYAVDQYWCLADATRLRQVVSNILGNALKFCEGKPVSIRFFLAPADEESPDKTAFIEICDQGIGMTLQQQELVFKQYEQAQDRVVAEKQGTGLGLSISKQIVEKMGGRIDLQSAPGEGSTFRIALPTPSCPAQHEASHHRQCLSARGGQDRSPRVLVVDDKEIHLRVAKAALESFGCTCDFANDGIEALMAAQERSFDMIFMDLRMPGMDGIEATRRLVGTPGPNQHTPIVALSASAFPEDIQACKAAGMVEHLAKPINKSRLEAIVLRHTFHSLKDIRDHG